MGTSFNPNQIYPLIRSTRYNMKYYGNLGLITSLGSYLNSVTANQFGHLFNSPSEFITSIKAFPFNLSELEGGASGTQNILLGIENSGISAKTFSSLKPSINLGRYTFNKYYNNFLDYNNFTKITVFLPYIGFTQLDPNEVMGKTVSFDYAIDLDTGECTCAISVIVSNTVKYVVKTASGKIGIDIPIGSTNAREIQKNFVNSMIGIVGGAVAMPFSKGFGVAMGVGMLTRGTKEMFNSLQYHYNKSGGTIQGLNNLPLPQSIYVIYERNNAIYYPTDTKGRPLQSKRILSGLHGYTEVDRFTDDFNLGYATREELDEVKQLLQQGVFLP